MNKWTPIEEGLPPVATPLIVSVVNNFEGKRKELRYPVYFELHPFEQRWVWRLNDGYLLPEYSEVEARMTFPTVYLREE